MFAFELPPLLDPVAAWADIATVSLYFLVMGALTIHGAHRMHLVRLYLARRKEWPPALPEPREWPRVTVQLPIYNERFVVEALLEAVCRLDYPRDKLDIQVLDDSTDDTSRLARRAVARLAAAGRPITYIHRKKRIGYKAGALQEALPLAKGDLIALFDADFSPMPDFLRRTVPYFADPGVGCVQTRWEYRNRDESLLTRVQGMLLDAHFVIEQVARSRSGLFFNFNGTAGVLRRSMIEDAGGWQDDTLTEDTDLSYRAQMRGWRFVYLPDVAVESELPADIASFQTQQARWAKGLMQTGLKILPALLRSNLPWRVKLEAFLHFSANASYPLMALLAALIVPSAIARDDGMAPWMQALDAPIFLTTVGSLAAYHLIPRMALRGRLELRDVLLFPVALACGIGLILTNTRGVLEALGNIDTPFERTAKLSASAERARLARSLYGLHRNWASWANLAAAGVVALGAIALLLRDAWEPMPFVGLFFVGFSYAGVVAMLQTADRSGSRQMREGARAASLS